MTQRLFVASRFHGPEVLLGFRAGGEGHVAATGHGGGATAHAADNAASVHASDRPAGGALLVRRAAARIVERREGAAARAPASSAGLWQATAWSSDTHAHTTHRQGHADALVLAAAGHAALGGGGARRRRGAAAAQVVRQGVVVERVVVLVVVVLAMVVGHALVVQALVLVLVVHGAGGRGRLVVPQALVVAGAAAAAAAAEPGVEVALVELRVDAAAVAVVLQLHAVQGAREVLQAGVRRGAGVGGAAGVRGTAQQAATAGSLVDLAGGRRQWRHHRRGGHGMATADGATGYVRLVAGGMIRTDVRRSRGHDQGLQRQVELVQDPEVVVLHPALLLLHVADAGGAGDPVVGEDLADLLVAHLLVQVLRRPIPRGVRVAVPLLGAGRAGGALAVSVAVAVAMAGGAALGAEALGQ